MTMCSHKRASFHTIMIITCMSIIIVLLNLTCVNS